MICKITGTKFHDLEQIAECLVIKNACQVIREANPKGSDGIAYRIDCKGVCIGYLPEIATLRKYYKDANTQEEQARIKEWAEAAKAVRQQFKIDYENNGQESWTGHVAGLLYEKDGKWIEFQDYSDLCQHDENEGWKLRQVAVRFDGVEAF